VDLFEDIGYKRLMLSLNEKSIRLNASFELQEQYSTKTQADEKFLEKVVENLETVTILTSQRDIRCSLGNTGSVVVKVLWKNPLLGNHICVFVQSHQAPSQPYYFQFQGTSGQVFIGAAPDNTEFDIIAVSTSSLCHSGNVHRLPLGTFDRITVKRINVR
jgi:hypothetical protein